VDKELAVNRCLARRTLETAGVEETHTIHKLSSGMRLNSLTASIACFVVIHGTDRCLGHSFGTSNAFRVTWNAIFHKIGRPVEGFVAFPAHKASFVIFFLGRSLTNRHYRFRRSTQ
jgi:hypothetical protein